MPYISGLVTVFALNRQDPRFKSITVNLLVNLLGRLPCQNITNLNGYIHEQQTIFSSFINHS